MFLYLELTNSNHAATESYVDSTIDVSKLMGNFENNDLNNHSSSNIYIHKIL